MLASGIIVWLVKAPPKSFSSTNKSFYAGILTGCRCSTFAVNGQLTTMDCFFWKAGAFVLGVALAIVPFIRRCCKKSINGSTIANLWML